MKKMILLSVSVLVFLVSTGTSRADATAAKQALSQSTTNSFCSAGYNGDNPYEKPDMYKKNPYEAGCPAGLSYVECLRKSWKKIP